MPSPALEAVFQGLQDRFNAGTLEPLTMANVATLAGCSLATVSRYAAAHSFTGPNGPVPCKALFSSALATAEGADVASRDVRALIQAIVAAAPGPMSDQAVSDALLTVHGVRCARRTVNKYRNP